MSQPMYYSILTLFFITLFNRDIKEKYELRATDVNTSFRYYKFDVSREKWDDNIFRINIINFLIENLITYF